MGTKAASKEKGEARPDADEGKPAAADGGAPLFPTASSDWIAVQVERLDPVEEEGFLGRLPITATEEQIRGRWGGGRFMCRAVNGQNQFKQNRTVSIAGDPVFISEVNRLRWIRGQGRPGDNAAAVSAAAAPSQQFGVAEIVTLFQGMQQMQSAQQLQFMQQQAEDRRAREEAERKRDDERRAEDRRREDQKRAEDKEREERRIREDDERRAREREFMSTTIQMVTANKGGEAGQMQAFLMGMSSAIKMVNQGGGGGRGDDDDDDDDKEEDPIAETVRGVIKGLGDTFIPGRKEAAAAEAPAAAPAAAPGEPEPVTLKGPLAAHVTKFVLEAKAAGKNPEALLASGVDVLMKSLQKKTTSNGAGVAAAVHAAKTGEAKPAA